MDENITFPIDDLQTFCTNQTNNLNTAWMNHQAHLQHQILQPASSLTGGAADTFTQHMTTWSTNLGRYFTHLSTFVNLLHTSTTDMSTLDTNIAQDYQGFE